MAARGAASPLRPVPALAGSAVAGLGVVVLVGWSLGLEPLKRIGTGLVAQNPTTAACLVLIGLALAAARRLGRPAAALVRCGCGGIVVGVGVTKIVDLLLHTDSGVDRMIFAAELAGPGTLNVNAMAPNTALALALLGLSLGALGRRGRWAFALTEAAAIGAALIATVAIIGYVYGALSLYDVGTYFPMALNTAAGVLIASLGLLASHPRHGVAAIVASPTLGGATARQLLPSVVCTPLVLGLLWRLGEDSGAFEPITGVAMFVALSIFALVAIMLAIANRLHRTALELAAHTVALEAATRGADAANRAKSTFLANMSHEIRTPMNGVLGMLEILEHTRLDDDQGRIVSTIRGSARSLLAIIDDILDLSKIEAGRISVAAVPTDVAAVIEAATRLFLGAAAAKEISLRCFLGASVRGRYLTDPGRLRQVLSNLISNALKFTVRGGVTVTADLLPAAAGIASLRLVVEDTGIGIPAEAQARLFQPFAQADDAIARSHGGTGLGLSISRRLMDLMGGTIDLASRAGEGTRLTLTLPLPIVDAVAEPDAPDLAGVHVALIAADPLERRYLAEYLVHWGASVTAAVTPDGLPRHSEPYALILASADQVGGLDATTGPIAVGPPRRVVLYTHADSAADHQPAPDTIVTTATSRARLVTAVAVAAGRKSPETEAVRIPAADLAKQAPVERLTALGQGRLILLAEDHPVNREVILRQLRLLGYAADAVETGAAALTALSHTAYGLLLTDCHMPELDGFALTRQIRAGEPPGRRLPIVALTANAMAGEADRCLAAGMDDYLAKPVDLATLRARLEQWLPSVGTADSPVLDRAQLAQVVGDDPEAIAATLQDFLHSVDADLAALQSAMRRTDAAATEQAAHRAKGAARVVGARRLVDVCQSIESAARTADWTAIEAQAPVLLAAAEGVRSCVVAELAERAG